MQNRNSYTVKALCLVFSLALLLAVPFAVLHTGETGVINDFVRILTSPCPLVTDYYALGSLPSAFLNAGLCGLFCALFMIISKEDCNQSFFAGFILVIAHCFYGLNLLSMFFPILGVLVFCKVSKRKFSENFDMAMLSTAFGPFFSEILWRYQFYLKPNVMIAVITCILLSLFLGFAIPAMLEGAKILHKGFDLYNAGLAFGLLGFFVYSFLFKTLGATKPERIVLQATSYPLFCNVFFLLIFLICLLSGFLLNGKSFKGFEDMSKDCSKPSDFCLNYGPALTLINIGFYGILVILYLDCVILLTDGVGWTGATCGVTFAAIAFSMGGQTSKNVWPVMLGYVALSIVTSLISLITGRPVLWSLSSQEYINGLAFATGLCPFTGCYGIRAGVIAGAIDAVICTSTSQLHGGLMLYNGGFTAGLTALILCPILNYYCKKKTYL